MKKIFALYLPLAAVCTLPASAQAPQVEIKNKAITAKVYTPDPSQGFYRTTRFDWSGAISDLEVAGHHLYRPFFNGIDPNTRDFVYTESGISAAPTTAMVGPVEEFQKPQGYDTAKVGDTFVKVGVGVLRRLDANPYQFGKKFDLVDTGTWTTTSTPASVTMTQTLGNAQSAYAYIYTKTLRLVGNESKLVIEHHLRNIGTATITTPVYDHNFLTIDNLSVGSAYSITVPYQVKSSRPIDPKFTAISGNKASYIADLSGQDRVSWNMGGFGDSPSDYDFRIVNTAAKLEVRIQGDKPLSNANVWSIRNVMAVEPFVLVSAEPGKEFSWTYTYTYTDLSKGN